jgi:hypothetical protein
MVSHGGASPNRCRWLPELPNGGQQEGLPNGHVAWWLISDITGASRAPNAEYLESFRV